MGEKLFDLLYYRIIVQKSVKQQFSNTSTSESIQIDNHRTFSLHLLQQIERIKKTEGSYVNHLNDKLRGGLYRWKSHLSVNKTPLQTIPYPVEIDKTQKYDYAAGLQVNE